MMRCKSATSSQGAQSRRKTQWQMATSSDTFFLFLLDFDVLFVQLPPLGKDLKHLLIVLFEKLLDLLLRASIFRICAIILGRKNNYC
jgi:hypothetical protein